MLPFAILTTMKTGSITLTKRELDVLRLVAQGCTYSQAAKRLGVSKNTVGSHIKNAYRKLGVRSAGAAVMRALERRLLPLDG